MMMLSDIIWWTGATTLVLYFAATGYIMAGVIMAYYRRRK